MPLDLSSKPIAPSTPTELVSTSVLYILPFSISKSLPLSPPIISFLAITPPDINQSVKMYLPLLALSLLPLAAANALAPQHIFSNPSESESTNRIPTSYESAVLARRILHLTGIGTLATVFPSSKSHSQDGEETKEQRPQNLGGIPIGLMGMPSSIPFLPVTLAFIFICLSSLPIYKHIRVFCLFCLLHPSPRHPFPFLHLPLLLYYYYYYTNPPSKKQTT